MDPTKNFKKLKEPTVSEISDMMRILPTPITVCIEDLEEIYSQEDKNAI